MGSGKKWIIRNDRGHIYGPFELPKIRELLSRGLLTGEEQAASYPAGDWANMSSYGELYDVVLEVLMHPKKNRPLASNMQEESAAEPPPPPKERVVSEPIIEEKKESKESKVTPFPGLETKTKSTNTPPIRPSAGSKEEISPLIADAKRKKAGPPPLVSGAEAPVIELKEKDEIIRESRLKNNLVPLLLLVAAFLLFFIGSKVRHTVGKDQTISLLVPQIKKNGNAARSESLVKEGWGYFFKDTFSSYIHAEESFVEAIEENPRNIEAVLMLILTDGELWAFSKQDSADQNALSYLIQLLSQSDRTGSKRAIGAVAVDIMLGREDAARSQVDSALAVQPTEGRLYELKGQLAYNAGDYQQAIGYFEKAGTLMPYWVKPVYMQGLCYSKLGNPSSAEQMLIHAIKMNASHSATQLELGIVESRFFGHEDKGRQYLTVALDHGEKLLPAIEARGRYQLALLMDKVGDRGGAREQAQMALRLNPSDLDVKELVTRLLGKEVDTEAMGNDRQHMALGDQYMRNGNYLGAQTQYKAAFAENPKNARAAMKAAQALWELHQSGEAVDFLQKSVFADPKFVESYVVLADYQSQRYDFEGASRALEQALKINSKSYEVYRGYAELFYMQGDMKTAESYANRAEQLYEIDVDTNTLLSKIKLAQKDTMNAVEYAKKAIELDKADVKAQVNYAKVLTAYEGTKSGTEYLRDLINTYPTQAAYRLGLAEIYMQDEQYSTAVQILTQILASNDSDKDAYMLVGDAEVLSGHLDNALNNYLSAARLDPSDPAALFRAGEVYLKANRPGDAQKQFDLVLRANPLFPRAHFSLAKVYFSQGITEAAIAQLEEEKKLNPKLAEPYELEGDLYLSTRKFAQAAAQYQKATELKPQGGALYVKMARAYRGQGSLDAAQAMLRLATEKESGYSEIYRELGYLYEARGQAEQAGIAFQQYLQLEPSAPDRAAIQQKINELK